jgi:hypothetical protein
MEFHSSAEFQVYVGQLWIPSFGSKEVICMFLILLELLHYSFDGKYISFSLLYYVYSLM